MRLSDRGLHLVTSFEGFPNGGRPYNDPVGLATVGYGHLIAYRAVDEQDHHSIWVHGQRQAGVLTPAEGARLLDNDLIDYQVAVERAVTRQLTQGQFDALTSFAYNVGVGGLRTSTLLRLFNEGHTQQAADEFPKWSRAGGHVLAGLLRRREAERELFLSADTDPLAGYPPNEVRWIGEYDALKHSGGNSARRAELVRAITEQRKRIWRAAQKDGWNLHHRRARYQSLLARSA
jgi:GH24 family phage-related lysozyme (muramidase)